MTNLRFIAETIENSPGPHKWTAEGREVPAIMCGFIRPKDSDPEGMWSHPEFGDFPDYKMPAVLNVILTKWHDLQFKKDLNSAIGAVQSRAEELRAMINTATECDKSASMKAIGASVRLQKLLLKISEIARNNHI